jgi:hypothetical protein
MESLLTRLRRLDSYDSTAFSEIVATGTGFSGSSRANLRTLCSKTGIKYCGDLISGWSTHLVVNDTTFNDESSSKKIQVAAKWGVPIVRLQWLLDSIQEGEPLCEDTYLMKGIPKDTTPAEKAAKLPVAAAAAPRPTIQQMVSSKQGSNSAPSRTPLKSVENVVEEFERLAVTPKEPEDCRAPSPAPMTEVSIFRKNSEGETPSASPCRAEIPSEIAVAIIECSPSPSLMPATQVEIEDEEEEEEDGASASPAPSSAQPQNSPQWWDSQNDSVSVQGSQPRSAEIPPTPEPSAEEEEQDNSFSFRVVAPASATPLQLPSPLPLLAQQEETPQDRTTSSMTPMSDMTPLDLQRPDMTTTRLVADSPSSLGKSSASDEEQNYSPTGGDSNADEICIIPHGGQQEIEWEYEDDDDDDWGGVDVIIEETPCLGYLASSPKNEQILMNNTEEEGEEPSPISQACSNHDDDDFNVLGNQMGCPITRQLEEKEQEEEEIDGDSDFEDEFYSENQIIARARAPLPPLPPIPSGLPQPEDDAVPLKVLHRAPRGSTVKARYRLANTKAVTFAETIHLRGKQLTLNSKEKQQAIVLQSSKEDGASDDEEEEELILAEPLSFYRCLGEDMQMEYHRLYTGTQAVALAEKAGVRLHLPPGFDASVELLKSTAREHADVRRVQGTVPVRKAKLGVNALKTKSAQGGKPVHYWRCEFDADVPEVLMP